MKEFACADQEGKRGDRGRDPPPPPHLKNHKNIGFLSNTGPNPLNNQKAIASQHSVLGYHRHASEVPEIVFIPGR